MNALRTALTAADLPENPAELRQAIEAAVRMGVPQAVVNVIKAHGKTRLLMSIRNGLSLKPVISG